MPVITFNVFHTNDCPERLKEDQTACAESLGFKTKYYGVEMTSYDDCYVKHGRFIEERLEEAAADEVVCILDLDCLPTDREFLLEAYEWARRNESFVGNAQCVGHNFLRNIIYAAPSMLMVHKQAWERLGRPTMSKFPVSEAYHLFNRDPALKQMDDASGTNVDTAELLTIIADRAGFPYRKLLPYGYDENPGGGLGDGSRPWTLGPHGYFGVGTHYPGSWHYFRISQFYKSGFPAIWSQRVREILEGGIGRPKFSSCPWQSFPEIAL